MWRCPRSRAAPSCDVEIGPDASASCSLWSGRPHSASVGGKSRYPRNGRQTGAAARSRSRAVRPGGGARRQPSARDDRSWPVPGRHLWAAWSRGQREADSEWGH